MTSDQDDKSKEVPAVREWSIEANIQGTCLAHAGWSENPKHIRVVEHSALLDAQVELTQAKNKILEFEKMIGDPTDAPPFLRIWQKVCEERDALLTLIDGQADEIAHLKKKAIDDDEGYF